MDTVSRIADLQAPPAIKKQFKEDEENKRIDS
jgi:hypothetical protein